MTANKTHEVPTCPHRADSLDKHIENIVWLMESISPVGTEVFQSYLETLNGKNQNPQDYSMSVDTQGTGLDAIESFGESNLPNKIKSYNN